MANENVAITGRDRVSFAADVELLALDDEGFIYSSEMESLVGLNRTATVIWRACAANRNLREVMAITEAELGLPREIAETFVKLAVVEWEKLGLLKDLQRSHRYRRSSQDRLNESPSPDSAVLTAAEPIFETRRFAVLDTAFTIACQNAAQAECVHAVVGHLEIAADAGLNTARAPVAITIIGENKGQEVYTDGRLSNRCDTLSELAPLIHWQVFSAAARDDGFALQLHTAAVAREGLALLLAGPAGAGKSTLSSALLDEGFGYLSDDSVVLDRDSFLVRGLPFSICVKQSGRGLLDRETQPTSPRQLHLRADGRRVHYRHPAPGSLIIEPRAARWVVFPRYAPDGAGSLRAITSAEALRRLLGLSATPRHLSRDTAAKLMAWAAGLQCCELEFPDVRFAIDAMLDFCDHEIASR